MDVEVLILEFEFGAAVPIEVHVALVVLHAGPTARTSDRAAVPHGRAFLEEVEIEALRPGQLLVGQVVAGRDERLREELQREPRVEHRVQPGLEGELAAFEIREQIAPAVRRLEPRVIGLGDVLGRLQLGAVLGRELEFQAGGRAQRDLHPRLPTVPSAFPIRVLQSGLEEDRGAPIGAQAQLVRVRPRVDHQRAAPCFGVGQRFGPQVHIGLHPPVVEELQLGAQRVPAPLVSAPPGRGGEHVVQRLMTPVLVGVEADAVAAEQRAGRDLPVRDPGTCVQPLAVRHEPQVVDLEARRDLSEPDRAGPMLGAAPFELQPPVDSAHRGRRRVDGEASRVRPLEIVVARLLYLQQGLGRAFDQRAGEVAPERPIPAVRAAPVVLEIEPEAIAAGGEKVETPIVGQVAMGRGEDRAELRGTVAQVLLEAHDAVLGGGLGGEPAGGAGDAVVG